jgi:ribosomal protein S18 acetylase RimI-like enzyme
MIAKKPIVNYRFANISDLDKVSFFGKELMDSHKKYGWYYTFKKNYYEEIKKETKTAISSKDSFVLVAEESGKLIGYCLVSVNSTPNEPMQIYVWKKEAEIVDLYVEKRYREHKVGENLLKKAFEMSKKKGIDVVRIVIDHRNKRAKHFYLKEGMDFYDEVFVKRLN